MPPQSHDSAETAATKESVAATTRTQELPLRAILVIHGIGQQQPFQPLDSFVNGLRATLTQDGKKVSLTHFMHGQADLFDHSFRVEATDQGGAQPSVRLDIYEFYWAPLTLGKASFTQIVRWLLVTGFTPIHRLAFNLPLVIQRAEGRTKLGRKDGRPPLAAASDTPEAGQSPQMSRFRWAVAVLALRKTFWLIVEFLCETGRLVFVPLVATALAAAAVLLVSQSGALLMRIPEALRPALQPPLTVQGAASLVFALVAAIAALGLALSIPAQICDLVRLRKVEPLVFQETVQAWSSRYKKGNNFLSNLVKAARAAGQKFSEVISALDRWRVEIEARRFLLPLSIISLVFAMSTVTWLCVPSPWCIGGVCPKPVVYNLLAPLMKADFVIVLLLLGVAFVVKRMFVDYFGDVALYTTADQNSAFYATRAAIRTEATRRVRYLLRDRQYESVAIAGHSLGSVIGYDAINELRVEAQLPSPAGALGVLETLAGLVAKLPTADANKAMGLLGQLESACDEPVETPGGLSDRGHREAASPVTWAELARLKTLITFGSPLNKVLYFFRVKIGVNETIRSHIVQEIHGYRQVQDLLTRDPLIQDQTEKVGDRIRWVNFYSPMDPVSGRLDFYSNVIEHSHWYLLWGKCHMSYWHDPKMYRELLAVL